MCDKITQCKSNEKVVCILPSYTIQTYCAYLALVEMIERAVPRIRSATRNCYLVKVFTGVAMCAAEIDGYSSVEASWLDI